MADADELMIRLTRLEAENSYLKSLLEQAGIAYEPFDTDSQPPDASFIPDQGSRILPQKITSNHARRFYSYFWGRTDVYSKRSQNKTTGRAAYYPQCDNFWKRGICPKASGKKIKCKDCNNRRWTRLESTQIENHLRGFKEDASDVIGIYPLFPDGTCRLLVFDFDNHGSGAEDQDYANTDNSWVEEVNALREIGRENGIPMLVERSRSGKGAHVWIFFDAPIFAALARKFGFSLLNKGAESVNMKSFRFYDRMLPAQDYIEDGGLGNLIALPLQGRALKQGNSAFIDEYWNAYPNQWATLQSVEKLSATRIEELLRQWNIPTTETSADGITATGNEDAKPWERSKRLHAEDVDGKVSLTISKLLYIKTDNLKPRIQNQIRRMAAFSNPLFFRNRAIGLSNYANPRYIYLGEDDSGYICIPRGLLEELTEKLKAAEIPYIISDKRCIGTSIKAEFTGELRDSQKKAVSALLQYDNGILSAATAFGKTVVCSNLIARRKVNTLILLESSSLIEQWEKSLSEFLTIDEELPEYKTKTGRVKKRKSLIGIIQGAKDTSTGIVDIAMVGSLYKKGEFHPRLSDYGMILVDECHHSASETVSRILREVSAKYVYGVTATPFRSDGLEKINEMLLGPVRFEYTAKEKAEEQGLEHLVVPRFTGAVSPHGREKLHINKAYEIIRNNELRNEQIVNDIKACVLANRTPVVLTRFTDHADVLYGLLKDCADHVFLLTGNKSKKEQRELRAQMDLVPVTESLILIATGQLIGEGFDFPRLDTLIMAVPVAWKGVVEQYAGRLNRDFEGKKNVMIYDYIDANIPVFDNMYAKRLKAYKRIGYKLYNENPIEKQSVNAIFDSDSYSLIFEQDLKEARSDIVISSPTLAKRKVMHIIFLLSERQEAGVKITIVTWHPDAYAYGSEEHRVELMEHLRKAGFNIELVENNCERYAVIDNEIVWYGSMNLLSRVNVEDNIMRVVSKRVAAELLEMTFKKGNQLTQYVLPLE
ncbi:MAG: TOTE conflict system archaeo-eukaryotic primase domain-containing protein [Anaerolineaceae bacterium]|jgi:superfamily II DNA or RNA helicase